MEIKVTTFNQDLTLKAEIRKSGYQDVGNQETRKSGKNKLIV